jgi:hypothetical protein
MTVTLEQLTTRFPQNSQTQIQAAIEDFSNRLKMKRYAQIGPVEGLPPQVFELPDDFLFIISLGEKRQLPDFFIQAGQLHFISEPALKAAHIWYAARHILVDDAYPHLEPEDLEIIALKLQADDLRGEGGFSYQIGQVRVDTKGMDNSANSLYQDYLNAIKARIGTVMRQARIERVEREVVPQPTSMWELP